MNNKQAVAGKQTKPTQAQHTPGPWNTDSGPFILAEDGLIVCRLGEGQHDAGSEVGANARLIAAAPDLLEALTRLENAIEAPGYSCADPRHRDGRCPVCEARSFARAAIAKATEGK